MADQFDQAAAKQRKANQQLDDNREQKRRAGAKNPGDDQFSQTAERVKRGGWDTDGRY